MEGTIDFENEFINLKKGFFDSKKYWIIYLVIVFCSFLCQMNMGNYADPFIEILTLIVVCVLGVFCISFYWSNYDDNNIYKVAFVIILCFGIVTCLLSPILCTPDEVEHFVRAEITSDGVLFPEYKDGSFLTIQSTMDLIEKSKHTWDTGFDSIDMRSASIFRTDADTSPINHTPVKYPSAFAQNPFFGYLPQAIGIALAKLLDLNAIWLVWLGRIFNIVAYAALASYAVKKSPILKIPLIAFACMPLVIFTSASVSIDAMIAGLSILAVAYFFYMYKSPKGKIDNRDIIKFSIIVILAGLCKVTCFALILLLFAVPRDNFEEGKKEVKAILALIIISVIALLWTKFYADPGFYMSFRTKHYALRGINPGAQINYMLSNLGLTFVTILGLPANIGSWDGFLHSKLLNVIYLLFLGAIFFLYPKEKFNKKSRIVTLIICALFFIGTYITFLLSWTPVGQLSPILGVQTRYFIPIFALIPVIYGFNHVEFNKQEVDIYTLVLTICFLAAQAIWFAAFVY